ncbi:12993_t:CDS:10 [Acaulospora morrowiae]|uniref:tRNA-dihydrouridine synthase n=1 Tax=Acaulospora morrowiae TaxID=94023 RepID=A0A9N8Z4A1_9GLOM|nr:12993_t:CDS:10 [Acaulospora morrowiae]
MSTFLNYRDKLILAPMVRIGTLPMRLLALEYGADLVYSPEMVDKKMIASERKYDGDFLTLMIITSISEKSEITSLSKIDFREDRIGTADPELALKAALKMKQDVSGIDVNCGCPKKFSIQGGMGAALLSNPDKLKAVNFNKPGEKLWTPGDLQNKNIGKQGGNHRTLQNDRIHGCQRNHGSLQRPKDPGHWDIFADIVKNITSIPVIANGDVFQRSDIVKLKELSNVNSIMIARAAQNNVSIFRKEGTLPLKEVVTSYIKKAIETENNWANTKYTLMQMYANHPKDLNHELLTHAKSYEELCKIFDLESYLQNFR